MYAAIQPWQDYYKAMYGGVFTTGHYHHDYDMFFLDELRQEIARRRIAVFPAEKIESHLASDAEWIAPAILKQSLNNAERQPHQLVPPDIYRELLQEELDKRQNAEPKEHETA